MFCNSATYRDFFSSYRNFYHFVLIQEPEIANEIKQDYIQTMSKLYYSYFKVCSTFW